MPIARPLRPTAWLILFCKRATSRVLLEEKLHLKQPLLALGLTVPIASLFALATTRTEPDHSTERPAATCRYAEPSPEPLAPPVLVVTPTHKDEPTWPGRYAVTATPTNQFVAQPAAGVDFGTPGGRPFHYELGWLVFVYECMPSGRWQYLGELPILSTQVGVTGRTGQLFVRSTNGSRSDEISYPREYGGVEVRYEVLSE